MAKILVIEDNQQVLYSYKRMLELAGHQVVGAANGNEGTRLYREDPADVVITDMVMPEKDGMETIMELRRDFPEVKIMPGVLIVEAIAQAGGILLYHSLPEPGKKLVVLSKIQSAKFRKIVVPGDQIELHAEIIKVRARFATIKGRATVNNEIAVEGEVSAAILDIEEANAPQ